MIDYRTAGKAIAALRQQKGMTQQQLAAAMNVSHQAVSKWETGAALPDIQTLMNLCQLFGVSAEQLLAGNVPGMEKQSDDPFESIGSFFNGVADSIGNFIHGEEKKETAEEKSEEVKDDEPTPEIARLLQMAPFMTREFLTGLVEKYHHTWKVEDLVNFAPFMDPEKLASILADRNENLNWDVLRKLAPYMVKSTVDRIAHSIVNGTAFGKPEPKDTRSEFQKGLENAAQTIGSTIDDASKRVMEFGNGVVAEVNRIGNEIGKAFEGLGNDCNDVAATRRAVLRRKAFEKALENGNWDWLEAHIEEIDDPEFRRKVAESANAIGMKEWVSRNLPGYAALETIDAAIESGNWDWLKEHAWKFDSFQQERIALAAMTAGQWQWLSECAERIALKNVIVEIAFAARRAGEVDLAVQLAHYDMEPTQIADLAFDALSAGDIDCIDRIIDVISPETISIMGARMAKAGDWENVKHFAAHMSGEDLERLMQIAIDAGDFTGIDMIDGILTSAEEPTEVEE